MNIWDVYFFIFLLGIAKVLSDMDSQSDSSSNDFDKLKQQSGRQKEWLLEKSLLANQLDEKVKKLEDALKDCHEELHSLDELYKTEKLYWNEQEVTISEKCQNNDSIIERLASSVYASEQQIKVLRSVISHIC